LNVNTTFMQLPSIKEITDKAQNAFKRFPVTLTWAIIGSFYIMYLIDFDSGNKLEEKLDIILTLILGICWHIGSQFFIEQQKQPNKWLWLKGLIIVLLFLFYWHLPGTKDLDNNPVYSIRFFLYFIGGHLFVLFAPFIKFWKKTAFWNYLKSVGLAIVRSALFSGVLYLGLVLALLAIDALFEANIKGERYGQLFVFCLGVVNTWIYLSDFPKQVRHQREIYFERALEVFVKFILIPLVILYVVILYAYGGKISLQWQLPKGWVSYLVTALALLGFLVEVIINPIQKNAKAWTIRNFYPSFYYALLPLVVLLFVAIFRRVADYGITENRYFVLVIAFWILGMALYLLISRNNKLIVLPLSLFGLAILSSFGPWSAFYVSKTSQINQFKKVYDQVSLNGKMATADEFNQLTSIIDYLEKRNAISELDEITGIAMKEAMQDTVHSRWKKYTYVDTRAVMDSLNITVDPDSNKSPSSYGVHYSLYQNQEQLQLHDISEFSYFSEIHFGDYLHKQLLTERFELDYQTKDHSLKLLNKNNESSMVEFKLSNFLKDMTKNGTDLSGLPIEKRSLFLENEELKAKVIFTNLSYTVFPKDSLNIHSASAYLLIKTNENAQQD